MEDKDKNSDKERGTNSQRGGIAYMYELQTILRRHR